MEYKGCQAVNYAGNIQAKTRLTFSGVKYIYF